MKPFRRRIRVARHEAAHAVVAEACGYPCNGVWLLDREGGYAEHRHPIQPDPMVRAMIALAGHAAEIKWHRAKKTLVPDTDHRTVRALGFRGRSLPTLLMLARGAVEENAVAIEAVARELVKRDLSGRDVRRIMKGVANG